MSWDLLGHEWAANLLKQHIVHGDVRHAYLFTGPPGIGRRSLALEFAQAINCLQSPTIGEACGNCRVCLQIVKLQQPDLSIVEPELEGGLIKVDQVRNLQRSLSLSPYEARFRIALLLNFQRANQNAQNALLKTLEEAPKQVILLLTADSPDNLLPTISSRCEILRLRPVSMDVLEKALISGWNIPQAHARLISHLSNGRPGLALQMIKDPTLTEKRGAWLDELIHLFSLNIRDRFSSVENLTRNRDQLRSTLQVWLSFCRDLLLITNEREDHLTNVDHEDEISALAARLGKEQIMGMHNSIDHSLELLEVNANLRLLVDNLLLEIPRIE
ncbi:MAG: DNA polymerase III subunit delta' [Chloroflexi bacterium]|nr:MAG: DNA polymerase III subunit delta' [Chloroflexota bacterium]